MKTIDQPIYLGQTALQQQTDSVEGGFLEVDGAPYYRIAHYDRMPPFFMSIVSAADHWMFISSKGGLTAGRKSPEHALFPYYTDDKIHDAQDLTGSKTLILAEVEGKTYLWEPFSTRYSGVYRLQRNLYKSLYGNRIRFEEVNHDLGLTFSYAWGSSERFGFVKQSTLTNHGMGLVTVRVLDGIQNLLPYGVNRTMQTERSTLLDAYKKNELEAEEGLGLFLLSAIPVDKAEPSEALKATTVWSTGLPVETYLLSTKQLEAFRRGAMLSQEEDIRAERGAYFVHATLDLAQKATQRWSMVAEVNQGPDDVVALKKRLRDPEGIRALLAKDVVAGTERLKRLIASADGLQHTEEQMTTARHYANVLFNVMRGGVFDQNHAVDRDDVIAFLQDYNRPMTRRHEALLRALPATLPIHALLEAAEEGGLQLVRLCYEYLPLTFSRRHGDPSRPWNNFSIDTRNEDGSLRRSYEGNWRDIFQNWEALGLSFPGFLESMISKFVNASTADGYNPYRITREGIDWEIVDPADPWSYIGYWGDHQIIYLLKLLERSRAHHPDRLTQFLTRRLFSYANVPYRIAAYQDLLQDPHNTIRYDEAVEARIAERVAGTGADGKLLWDAHGDVYLVNLTEKLLVTVLAKLTNFIPEGGIWMNTQRPEWNDANNALVGYGVSMVTLYYLRRFMAFAVDVFGGLQDAPIALSEEVADLLHAVTATFERYRLLLDGPMTDQNRKEVLDALGTAGSDYRLKLYQHGFSGDTSTVRATDLVSFLGLGLSYMDHSIYANQRADRLFHAYNLMSVTDEEGIAIHRLYEMLEGQVGVLSAGVLSGQASLEVLDALRTSALYREDQNSYLLYPDRRLPRFVEKNNIPPEIVDRSPLMQQLLADGNRQLLVKDEAGGYHFRGSFSNKNHVKAALEELREQGYAAAVAQEGEQIMDVFETLFNHRAYTGRSGTFFGYEGLGSIYWHMVSKLVLAIQETFFLACDRGENADLLDRLAAHYFEAQAGIGLSKPPEVYGAFPMDPYSHTPGNAGAKQPGMTGQVKEDIICRWGELGIRVTAGQLGFDPALLRKSEFLSTSGTFAYFDGSGQPQSLSLQPGMLAFTYCNVPVCFRLSSEECIKILYQDGTAETIDGLTLDAARSAQVFSREGSIQALEVELMPAR